MEITSYLQSWGLDKFVEIKQFGLNAVTVAFFGTLLFTVLQAIALLKQRAKVRKTRSGESVSFIFFTYFGFSALAVSIYGNYKSSLALVLNGLLGFFSLAIVVNLLRFKPLSKVEKRSGIASMLVIPAIIIFPQKDIVFFVFCLIISATLLLQIVEIIKNKSSGSVHPTQSVVSIFSSSFWLTYAVITGNWALMGNSILALAMWATMIALYYKYKTVSQAVTQ